MKDLSVIILAAGKGVRMKSDLPKVVHRVCGREMINHVVESVKALEPSRVIVVVGYKSDVVKDALDKDVVTVCQEPQLGTGHAVMQALPHVSKDAKGLGIVWRYAPC